MVYTDGEKIYLLMILTLLIHVKYMVHIFPPLLTLPYLTLPYLLSVYSVHYCDC